MSVQNHRGELGPIVTCNSGAKGAVLNAKIHRLGVGQIETCNSGPKVVVLYAKTIGEVWEP